MSGKRLLSVLLMLVGLLGCQSEKPDIYKTKQGNFASKEGKFVAEFPKEPTVTVQENKIGHETINVYLFESFVRPQNYYRVSNTWHYPRNHGLS